MRRLAGLLLFCVSLGVPAWADDTPTPETLRAAQELSVIVNADTITQMTGAMTAQIWPNIENSLAGKVDAATLAEMRGEFEHSVSSFAAETVKYAPAVYARHFSAQELHEMLAFYRTPTGAKALHMMPTVMADVMAQMAPRTQAFQQDLNTKLVAIMQKHGYKN